jgi:SagB-type dehydrogenase family enzyme
VRRYARKPLRLAEAGQLLWAAQGVTHSEVLRTAPSAGALHPLRTYLVADRVESLVPGLYAYLPSKHCLRALAQACLLSDLTTATWGQDWVGSAAAALVLTADYAPTTARYGERGRRYVHIEVGHAAENAHLQATALGLSSAVVGAFDDRALAGLLGCGASERPLCLVAVGRAPE